MFDHRKSRAVAASKNTINSDWPQEERREGPDPCVSHCATSTVLPGKWEIEKEEDSQAHPQRGKNPVLSVQSTSFLSREASC